MANCERNTMPVRTPLLCRPTRSESSVMRNLPRERRTLPDGARSAKNVMPIVIKTDGNTLIRPRFFIAVIMKNAAVKIHTMHTRMMPDTLFGTSSPCSKKIGNKIIAAMN